MLDRLGAEGDRQAFPCSNNAFSAPPLNRKLDLRQMSVSERLLAPCFKASKTTAITSSSPPRASGDGQGLHVHSTVVQLLILVAILGATWNCRDRGNQFR